MLPKTQGLHVHNRELEEVEMSPDVQHRVTSMSEDAIEQNSVAALPSRTEEDGDGVEPSPQTNTVLRLGKDVRRIIAFLVFSPEYVTLIGRRQGTSKQ